MKQKQNDATITIQSNKLQISDAMTTTSTTITLAQNPTNYAA